MEGQPGGPDAAREPSEAELRAALEEQMKHIRVDDVILQTVATLVNLAGRRLGLASDDPAERDVAQAQQAIDAVRVLMPFCPQEQIEPIQAALSQLQMAFAREAQTGAVPSPEGGDPGAPAAPGAPEQAADPAEDAERAKARAKLWTPPGA